MQTPDQLSTPIEWIISHLQAVGWPTLIVLAWKISGFLTKVEQRFERLESFVIEGHAMLSKATTNELPHIQDAIEHLASLSGFKPK